MEQIERFGRPLGPVYQINRDCTYLCNTNTYRPLHPPQLRVLVTMPKGARGLAFKAPKLKNLADIVEEIVPISRVAVAAAARQRRRQGGGGGGDDDVLSSRRFGRLIN